MSIHQLPEITAVKQNRFLTSSARELVLLAPSATRVPAAFRNVDADEKRYGGLLEGMQRLRAQVYLKDRAVRQSHVRGGLHRQPADHESWHLLLLDGLDRVCGCTRYREHTDDIQFPELGVARSAIARCSTWGNRLRWCVDAELALCRQMSLPYVEVGGWALLEKVRNTSEAVRMILATYGLAQLLGGGIGLSTATWRNSSASILRRMGGLPMEHGIGELPPYHDPQYGCHMEILRFYSWAPNPRYTATVDELKATLRNMRVVTSDAGTGSWPSYAGHDAARQEAGLQFRPKSAVLPVN